MPFCKKGHAHNTDAGVAKCDLKYADRRVGRIAQRPRTPDEPIRHSPPRQVMMGAIPVLISQESRNRPY